MFRSIISYLGKAVRSNTGISSLSLITVVMGIMSVILLIVVCICMLIEVIATNTITASIEGYAAIIGSVAALITAVGLPKAINNYGENKYHSSTPETVEEE